MNLANNVVKFDCQVPPQLREEGSKAEEIAEQVGDLLRDDRFMATFSKVCVCAENDHIQGESKPTSKRSTCWKLTSPVKCHNNPLDFFGQWENLLETYWATVQISDFFLSIYEPYLDIPLSARFCLGGSKSGGIGIAVEI